MSKKKFSYLPSFEKATDELKDNISNIQGTLTLQKSKIGDVFTATEEPSAVQS